MHISVFLPRIGIWAVSHIEGGSGERERMAGMADVVYRLLWAKMAFGKNINYNNSIHDLVSKYVIMLNIFISFLHYPCLLWG